MLKAFLPIELKKMTSNLSDDIVKVHVQVSFFICIYCFNKRLSINGRTQENPKI